MDFVLLFSVKIIFCSLPTPRLTNATHPIPIPIPHPLDNPSPTHLHAENFASVTLKENSKGG